MGGPLKPDFGLSGDISGMLRERRAPRYGLPYHLSNARLCRQGWLSLWSYVLPQMRMPRPLRFLKGGDFRLLVPGDLPLLPPGRIIRIKPHSPRIRDTHPLKTAKAGAASAS